MGRSALILSGGVSHDFADSSAALAELLEVSGYRAVIESDLDAGLARLPDFDLLVFNTLRWSMTNHERFAAMRPTWGYAAGAALKHGVAAHLGRGRGIYALHAASICFDDWPEWRELIGAVWRWDESWHAPVGPAAVAFAGAHPLTEGLSDFALTDEIYTNLSLAADARPLAFATQGDKPERWPVLFAREKLGGRVIYDALGHDHRSIGHPVHAELIRRGLRWIAQGEE